METLEQTLESIKLCNACWLMEENNKLSIPYIPILPKPQAKFVFIGRDPSPRTAVIVGKHEGRSVFIKEIFSMVNAAKVDEEKIYITDMCKCHWRTSKGNPLRGTENRLKDIPKDIAKKCIENWLFKEIEILNPKIIFSFGEELYSQLIPYIIEPNPPLSNLSLTKDKSKMDAELYFTENGPMKIQIETALIDYVPLRHPGNSSSLPKSNETDIRWQSYFKSRERAIELLMKMD